MSSNPFIDPSGNPTLPTCVVAYLDILGFKDAMKAAIDNGTQINLLQNLREALNKCINWIASDLNDNSEIIRDNLHIKTFTDSIVVGYPCNPIGLGEMELGGLLNDLAAFQLVMATEGFFIRGGISVGGYYQDEDIVYGDGLLNAYKSESEVARDPRVVLDESALKLQRIHFGYYASPEQAPQYGYLRQDVDSQIFLCYLNAIYIGEDRPFYNLLKKHRDSVQLKLIEFRNKPNIWSKYLWVANYHNSFCMDDPQCSDCTINLSDFTVVQKRIDPNTLPSHFPVSKLTGTVPPQSKN